jgi:hypothetical protein
MQELKTIITEIPMNVNIKYNIYKSESKIFLEINYLENFFIQKYFQDNHWGKQECKKFIKKVDSENKIRDYLKL